MSMLKLDLEKLGLFKYCEFAFNGEEAVSLYAKLTGDKHDVSHILTDFMMPRLNGVQAMKKILSYHDHLVNNMSWAHPPPQITFMTSYKTSHFEKLLGELKVHSVYEKPLSQSDLRRIL